MARSTDYTGKLYGTSTNETDYRLFDERDIDYYCEKDKLAKTAEEHFLCRFNIFVKTEMKNHNSAQYVIAQDLGISDSVFSRYLSGEKSVPFAVVVKIAEYFSTTIEYLIGVTDFSGENIDNAMACKILGISTETYNCLQKISSNPSKRKILDLLSAYPDEIDELFEKEVAMIASKREAKRLSVKQDYLQKKAKDEGYDRDELSEVPDYIFFTKMLLDDGARKIDEDTCTLIKYRISEIVNFIATEIAEKESSNAKMKQELQNEWIAIDEEYGNVLPMWISLMKEKKVNLKKRRQTNK